MFHDDYDRNHNKDLSYDRKNYCFKRVKRGKQIRFHEEYSVSVGRLGVFISFFVFVSVFVFIKQNKSGFMRNTVAVLVDWVSEDLAASTLCMTGSHFQVL